MKFVYKIVLFVAIVFTLNKSFAQPLNACFSATNGQAFPVSQCGPFFLQLNNCSTGSYDSAIWNLQISSNFNCSGPWGITFTTSKSGTQATTGTGYSLTVYGSYKLCLSIYNKTTNQWDSTCQCIAIVYPIPVPNFTVSDTSRCGSLTTTFTPVIQSGTPPFGPITWFFGDNQTSTVTGASAVSHTYSCKNTNPPCYSVTIAVTDAKGCSKVLTKPCIIDVPCKPSATIAVTGGNLCSAPTNLTLTATPTNLIGAGIYSWWFPPSSFPPFAPTTGPSRSKTVQRTINSYGCNDVIVAIKDSITGCSDTTLVKNAVCMQGVAVTSLSANATSVCCNDPFTVTFNAGTNPASNPACAISGNLFATPVGGGTIINLGSISSSSPSTFSIPCTGATSAVTYNVCFVNNQVTNLCNNCVVAYTGCFQITIKPAPTSKINLTPPTQISYCSKGQQFCFNASTPANNLPGASYQWWIGAVIGTPAGTSSSFCQTFPNFGSYKIFLKVCQSAANGGCCTLDSITVSQVPPVGSFVVKNSRGCDSVCAKVFVTPKTDSLYIYYFGDGSAPITSSKDSMAHCYKSNKDTCFTIKVVHIAKKINGLACVDTITQSGVIKIGHKITPVITMAPPTQCLINKQACVYVYPNNPGLIPLIPPKPNQITCPQKSCHWYFTKPDDKKAVVQSFICDSPRVCFDDTGRFDAYYVISNNFCTDTLKVPRAVLINGIIGDFSDSVKCVKSGSLNNQCVKFTSTFKVYPTPTANTNITFIVNQGTCAPASVYTFSIAPNGPPPSFSHCFCNTGSFKVTMITSNPSSNCPADTTIKTIVVSQLKAQIDLIPNTTSLVQCAPYNYCFTAANSLPKNPPPPNIVWSFGDGKSSTALSPCHKYDTCGNFNVRLIVANATFTCSDTTNTIVKLHDIKPKITITATNPNCAACFTFTNQTVYCGGTPDSMYLAFGDGNSVVLHGNWSTLQHCYTGQPPGNCYYDIVDDFGCRKNGYFGSPTVTGIEPCMTGLIDTVVCFGTTMSFNDCSFGTIGSRCWTMSTANCGQNTTCVSTTPNYSHTFNSNGYFYLNLHLSNGYNCSADTCVRIHVQNPVADFYNRDSIPCPGSFDTLTNLTTGAYDKLIVSMDAPAINFYQTFTYYKNAGGIPKKVTLPIGFPAKYRICWNAISSTGCSDSICKDLYVAGPVGKLTCSNVYACVGDTVCCQLVTNSTKSPIIKYPEGSFDILPYNPSGVYNFCHKYTIPGHLLVQSFIDDGIGCSYPLLDTVHIDGPTAEFSWLPYKKDFCGKATVVMVDSSYGSLYPVDTAKHKWAVIDATGNIVANYSHAHPTIKITTPGQYKMRMIVKSTFGCVDTIIKPFINIWPYPTSQFAISNDTICVNQCVNFTNSSINPDVLGGYKWYFSWPNLIPSATSVNAQYCYPTPGTFDVILVDSSIHGCIDTSGLKAVIVLPNLQANFIESRNAICGNSGSVTFTSQSTPNNGITWEWKFGDGTAKVGPGNFPITSHIFTKPAAIDDTTYTITMIIRNSTGCIDSSTKTVQISAAPIIGLLSTTNNACHPLQTSFTDISNSLASLSNYYIDYGDGSIVYNSSTKPLGISKTYTNFSATTTSTFIATYMITTQFGCMDTTTQVFNVYPIPVANFTADNDSICGTTGTINFNSNSTPNNNVNWMWSFGDGTAHVGPGNFPNPNHLFTIPTGIADTCYTVSMSISNQFTCADTTSTVICISPLPQLGLTLGSLSSCNPLITSFKDNSLSTNSIANYYLDFGDGSTPYNSTTPPNLPITYNNISTTTALSFISNYMITTQFGCTASQIDTFNVYPIPVACAGVSDSVCPGTVNSIGCPPITGFKYNWYAPAIPGTFAPKNTVADPIVIPITSNTYSVEVTNTYGCKDSADVTLWVKSLVVPYGGRDTSVCPGGPVNLFAQGGNTYLWKRLSNDSIIAATPIITVNYPQTDSFRVIITGDCNTDSVDIIVFRFEQPNVDLSPVTANIIAGRKYAVNAISANKLVSYEWKPSTAVECPTCPSTVVSPDVNTTYTVVLTDNYGCKDSAQISIYVLCDKSNSIYIPNAFEPLSTNTRNAYFYVQGTGIKEVSFLRIYNRWGTELFFREHFQINKPELGWDGTFNGTKVTNDVYMYQMQIICANGTVFPISGNFTVIK